MFHEIHLPNRIKFVAVYTKQLPLTSRYGILKKWIAAVAILFCFTY